MNTNQTGIQSRWREMHAELKRFFVKLTDEDLMQIDGNAERLLSKLQERYGYTREQAEAEWLHFTRQNASFFNTAENGVRGAAFDGSTSTGSPSAENGVKGATFDPTRPETTPK